MKYSPTFETMAEIQVVPNELLEGREASLHVTDGLRYYSWEIPAIYTRYSHRTVHARKCLLILGVRLAPSLSRNRPGVQGNCRAELPKSWPFVNDSDGGSFMEMFLAR